MKLQHLTLKVFKVSLVLMLSVYASNALAKAELERMRIGQTEQKTRIVFDLKQLSQYKVFRLSHPSRLVVDFYKTTSYLSFNKRRITDKRLQGIRVSDSVKRIRVVLELHKQTSYKVFTLSKSTSKKQRLVIDLIDAQITQQSFKKRVKKVKPAKVTKVTQSVPMLAKNSYVVKKPKMLVIAIDAGHGGKDVGATGHNRVLEKVVTLKMAKELKRLIDKKPGMRAILTRNRDVFIHLHERVKIAKKYNANLFVSIHADAFDDASVRGGSVYVLSKGGASSTMARLLAKKENAYLQDIKLTGMDDDVAFALSDLSKGANIKASKKLANIVLSEMRKQVRMHKGSVQSAKFAVLRSIDMPSLLIETAFISNPQEARNLMNSKFQTKMASAIVSGLSKYVTSNAKKADWVKELYVYYKVQRGDTLSHIAKNYQVTTQLLKTINHIKNINELYVGREIKIPVSNKVIAGL